MAGSEEKMKGLFIPEITAEMFRNGCLESIEALMAEGELYDIDYNPKHPEPCEDAVSRKDVLDAIMSEPTEAHYPSWYAEKVKALLSVRPEPCEDAVSRQAAIDDLHGKDPSQIWDTADIEVWINTLPSAQPKPRTGKWMGSVCTACGESYSYSYDAEYCPNCGAKMED